MCNAGASMATFLCCQHINPTWAAVAGWRGDQHAEHVGKHRSAGDGGGAGNTANVAGQGRAGQSRAGSRGVEPGARLLSCLHKWRRQRQPAGLAILGYASPGGQGSP